MSTKLPLLSTLIFLPTLFALVMPFLPSSKPKLIHGVATGLSLVLFYLSIFAWSYAYSGDLIFPSEVVSWFPALGIQYSVSADSVSWMLVVLTTFLLLMSVIASISSIHKQEKLYYSLLFLITTSLLGVFLARDMFLFFLFWELELIPMYLLIAIWGGARREYAAMKFVLYTLFGSAFMLAAVLGLFYLGWVNLGHIAFDFNYAAQHIVPTLSVSSQVFLFLGFFIAFCIKLPMVPFHTWLPDAHVEAPTPVSMLLAGIMLKMGAYGMLRFCFTWFPEAAQVLAPYLVLFGVINIVYTAGIAMVQTDLKKLIAYSSVSHMGFVLLGLGALNATGFNGAMFQMISHGLISAGLFMIVGTVYNRTHTRVIAEMGGLGKVVPSAYFFAIVLAMASLGLPLLGGFPAESLVFYGAFLSKAFTSIVIGGTQLALSIQTLTVIAAIGVVLAAAYLLWMVQRVFMGSLSNQWSDLKDLGTSEVIVLACLVSLVVGVGIFPNHVLSHFEPQVTQMALPYAALDATKVAPAGLKPTEKKATKKVDADPAARSTVSSSLMTLTLNHQSPLFPSQLLVDARHVVSNVLGAE
jgi:NADH-quinone oxidoreductase subunit M